MSLRACLYGFQGYFEYTSKSYHTMSCLFLLPAEVVSSSARVIRVQVRVPFYFSSSFFGTNYSRVTRITSHVRCGKFASSVGGANLSVVKVRTSAYSLQSSISGTQNTSEQQHHIIRFCRDSGAIIDDHIHWLV